MLKGWVSASGSHCEQEGRAGYHCVELGMPLCGYETEKCIELEHTVEGFRAREKHYLSLLIIVTILGAFKWYCV